MSKHTPGPWTIRESATHVTVVGADNETIFHDDKRIPRVMSDARLVAAAPELFTALEKILHVTDEADLVHDDQREAFVFAKYAIAKATGGEA